MSTDFCLETITGLSPFPVILARMDLLPFGGGSKIPRFTAWLDQHPQATRFALLSDPGSHSFVSLARLLKGRNLSATFFERDVPLNPYTQANRAFYLDNPAIQVRSLKKPSAGLAVLSTLFEKHTVWFGPGGHVKGYGHVYDNFWHKAEEHLQALGLPNATHLLAVASADTLESFLTYHQQAGNAPHVAGVLTGHPRLRGWLTRRFKAHRRVQLFLPRHLTWEEYQQAAHQFWQKSGVWLDPLHTIQLSELLPRLPPTTSAAVLWVSCPNFSNPVTPV